MTRSWVLLVLLLLGACNGSGRANDHVQNASNGTLEIRFATVSDEGHSCRRLRLPDVWDKQKPAHTERRVYGVQFELGQLDGSRMALYIPRVGNRYKIRVNGIELPSDGRLDDTRFDLVQHPQYQLLPDGALRAGVNQLDITVVGETNRYAGLSRLYLGPDSVLRSGYLWRRTAQVGGSMVVVAVCAVFTVFAAALFVGLRQSSDLFFALSCGFCSVRTSHLVIEEVPFDRLWWAWTVDLSYAGLAAAIVMFCVRTLQMNHRFWTTVTLVFVGLSLTLVSWHVFGVKPGVRQAWLLLMLAYVTVVSLSVIARWRVLKTSRALMLAIAAGGGLLIGVHDHLLVYHSPDGYGGFALARFALVLFILAMGWIIVDRLISRMREEREMREAVALELANKKQQLEFQYAREAHLLAEQAQVREREKLVQDLHDGMGLQLNSLLGMVERRDADPKEVQQEVLLSIEQLRTLVDGAEKFDGSLAELLGQVRYRVDTRLRRQGVALHWHSDLGQWADGAVDQLAALNLQHLLYELSTNVIKHSGAKSVMVECKPLPGSGDLVSDLSIRFVDDGLAGTNVASHRGGGHRSIKRRVDELGGTHELQTSPAGGWEHRLIFPLASLLVKTLPASI